MSTNPTSELVANSIALVPNQSTEDLSHTYKCLISDQSTANRKLTEPLLAAILKELRTRTKSVVTENLSE